MQKLWAKKLQLFDTKSPHELGSSGAAQKNCHRRPCVPEHKRAQQTVWDWRDRPNANKMIRSNEQCSLHLYVDPASSIFCIELLKRFTWLQKYLWLILQTVLMVLGTWSEHRRIFWKFKSLEFESAWCWNKINQNRNNHHGTSAPLTRLARRSLGQNRHDESPHMPHCLPQSAKGTKAQHGLLWTRQCNWSPKNITLCNPRDICLAWLFTNHLPQIRHFPHRFEFGNIKNILASAKWTVGRKNTQSSVTRIRTL